MESTWPDLGFECWGKVMGIPPFSMAQLCGRGGRTEVKVNRKGLRRETEPDEGSEAFETFSSGKTLHGVKESGVWRDWHL